MLSSTTASQRGSEAGRPPGELGDGLSVNGGLRSHVNRHVSSSRERL